jgi:ABC-type glycerol-3-phosphate transport system substrate-binding protein
MKLKRTSLALFLLVITMLLLASSSLFAQNNTIVLTVGMPDWMTGNMGEELFDQFEADHPGVSVVLVSVNSEYSFPTPAQYDTSAYLDGIAQYVASADVLMVTNYNINVAGTRAGYFLDLTPLIATDTTLNEADFFLSMWQSFQWDMGVWALPVSASYNILIYDKAAFDSAGIAYPDGSWTFTDFADAARALTQRNPEGEVTLPGFFAFDSGLIMRGFLSQGYYDDSVIPTVPLFTTPELVTLMDEWYALEQEGVFGTFSGEQNWDSNEIPMRIEQPFSLMFAPDAATIGGSLLPGNNATLDLNAVALSAGTEQPELAYELAKYMTENVELVSRFFGITPARQSLVGVEAENAFFPDIPEEIQALLDEAIVSALPLSELRFSGYISRALEEKMRTENMDAQTALQEMEQQAITDLQTAEERRGASPIFVATPVPTPVLAQNEIALKFGVNMFTSQIPNEEGWDTLIEEFTAQDPDVGFVELNVSFDDMPTFAAENDCFYLGYNGISNNNTTLLLSLDPLLDADFDFDENDVAPGVMGQLQRDGLTYALPMTIQPAVLWYNTEMFSEAGVFHPEAGWTVSEFEDALRGLRVNPEDPAPFQPNFGGGDYILMLAGAYGGIPIDYSTNPPTFNFTDPATVEALRQVLDLAREGYIDYSELGGLGGLGGGFGQSAIYNDNLSAFSFQFQIGDSEFENPYSLTSYPRGTQYTPVSYGIGTGYISATAQNPDACYRFLSALAKRPDLLGGVPAQLSLLDDPTFSASQTPDALNFYRSYFEVLQDPNVLIVPNQFSGAIGDTFPGTFVVQIWLFQAFDAYVLEDGDLDAELQEAQLFADSYMQCVANIPPFDDSVQATQEEQIDYFRQFAECAVLVDPEMESLFGFVLEDDD